MSQPEPMDFGKHIDAQEASQLAMRGALDTIHKLQEITEGLRAQLRDTSNQNRALQEQLEQLRAQQQARHAAIAEAGTAGAGMEEKRRLELQFESKLRDAQGEMTRSENRLKETYRDKEIRLTQQWMGKENRLMEEFRQQLDIERQKLESERVRHQADIVEVEKRWESYAREKQALWESRAKESLQEIERYDTELLKNLMTKEMSRLEGRLSHQTQEIAQLQTTLQEKQQTLSSQEQAKASLQKQLHELTLLLKQARLEQVQLKKRLYAGDAQISEQQTQQDDLLERLKNRDAQIVTSREKIRHVITLLKRSRSESRQLQQEWAREKKRWAELSLPRAEIASLLTALEETVVAHARQRAQDLQQRVAEALHMDFTL